MVYSGSLLMLFSPLTPLHAGVGRASAVVDLPVQRDSLGFPIIYASSLKGAIKTHVYLRNRGLAKKLFGPDPDDESEKYASPVSLTDAYPLLIPARSAKSNPVMITSPFMIKRALDLIELTMATEHKDEERISKLREAFENLLKDVNEGEAAVLSEKAVINLGGHRKVIICGEALNVKDVKGTRSSDFENSWNIIKEILPQAFRDTIPERIVVLHDDTALRLIEKSMIRLTRIRLNRTSKTIERGGLWTEEYLPHGTLLISAILYSKQRAAMAKINVADNKELRNLVIKEGLGIKNQCGYVIFGGKESIGKGITRVCLI